MVGRKVRHFWGESMCPVKTWPLDRHKLGLGVTEHMNINACLVRAGRPPSLAALMSLSPVSEGLVSSAPWAGRIHGADEAW